MEHTLSLHEALPLFEENLADIRVALLDNAQAVIKEYSPYAEWDIDTTPVSAEVIRLHCNYLAVEQKTKPLFNTIKRIDSYRYHKLNPHAPNMVTDMDIQRAREIDDDWFIQEAGLSTRKPHHGICPFHPDTKPSLTLMKSKAKGTLYLKCFVCNEAWDSLSYIMKRDNVNFLEAVRYIVS